MEKNGWRERLKPWRDQRELSQKALGKIVGLSQSIISQMENGPRDSFRLSSLNKVLKFHKKTYVDLFCPIEPQEAKAYLIQNKRKTDNPSFNPQEYRKIPPSLFHIVKS